MSFGQNSTLYTPLTAEMLPGLRAAFPKAAALDIVDQFFKIMTDHCVCELLLVVTNLTMVERYLRGNKAYLPLSAIKTDKRGKMQTGDMKLIHDLLKFHGIALVTMHSCGGEIVPFHGKTKWYVAHRDEQLLRTELDRNGTMTIGVAESVLFAECDISLDYHIVTLIVQKAFAILESQQELLAA
jgi:hypothetical protein